MTAPAFNAYALAVGLLCVALALFGLRRSMRVACSRPALTAAARSLLGLLSAAVLLGGLVFVLFAFSPPDF